ncbi:MAG: hydrolase [Lacrimispora sp.]|nr:hydrolase [Lacrimispora sp.]
MIAFQIHTDDNVATALEPIKPGKVRLRGERLKDEEAALEEIPPGHKISLCTIQPGEDIIKYGVVIGRATEVIREGSWVHLHNIRSVYDERSSHLDVFTGAPKDTRYE